MGTTVDEVAYGHYEADECGSLNEWLHAAPNATPAQGATGVLVSLGDLADREPRALTDGEVLDLGGKRVRWLDTPHVPHGWDAGLLHEESTGTLLCGDLFTLLGDDHPATTDGDIVTAAIEADDAMGFTVRHAGTAPTLERLAALVEDRVVGAIGQVDAREILLLVPWEDVGNAQSCYDLPA